MKTRNPTGPAIEAGAAPAPLVSLGLPVYNGENYLRQALDSLLAQTYPAWEVILSDNGSTDSTPDICAAYAARDGRVRYYRQGANMGASWNHNFVFALARGPLFRWTAHDDVCSPDLLEKSVAALQAHPEAVLCHPRTRVIGPGGELLYDYRVRLRTDSPRVEERFHDLICLDHSCFEVFGVVRASHLRRTPLLAPFVGADRNLLAELALMGPFLEIPEYLFFRRDHPDTSTRKYPLASQRLAWFRDAPRSARHPTFRRGYAYLRSVVRAPLPPRERLACLRVLAKWTGQRAASLAGLRGFLGPSRKCYTFVGAGHERAIDPMRRMRRELQRVDEGLPVLRSGEGPADP
jgi:glycosyltransferase involved in cell wall biosynthesis